MMYAFVIFVVFQDSNKSIFMHSANNLEIPFSKTKIGKLVAFSVVFLLLGLWMLLMRPQIDNVVLNSVFIKNFAAISSILMGLLGVYFFTPKLLGKKPGLILSDTGFLNDSGALKLGFIPWSDIIEIQEMSIQASITSKQRFILLKLKNAEQYLSNIKSPILRKLASANMKNYGTPIHISTNGLKIKHDELFQLMTAYFEKSKKQTK